MRRGMRGKFPKKREVNEDYVLSPKEVEHEIKSWSFSKEREFIMNVTNFRFNFMLVIYTLVWMAVASYDSIVIQRLMLVVGCIICAPLALSINKTSKYIEILHRILNKIEEHPIAVEHRLIKANDLIISSRKIVYNYLPPFCVLTLLLAFVLSFLPLRPIFTHH